MGDVDTIVLTNENVVGVSQLTEQDKMSVVGSFTGDYMNNPDIGLNAIDFLHDNTLDSSFCREVNKQCTRAGMKVRTVTLVDGDVIIDAAYEN